MSKLKAYKYRLYPNKKQAEKLQWTLDRARELSNAAIQERRDAYEIRIKRHPNYHDEATRKQLTQEHALTYPQQATQLPEIKEVRPEYNDIHSQVLQDVLRRVDKAYQAFFRRVKEGKTPGYPRFHGYGRYASFTFPQSGFSLTEDNREPNPKIVSSHVTSTFATIFWSLLRSKFALVASITSSAPPPMERRRESR